MTKQMKGSRRVLSFVLALCLIVGIAPMMAPSADAVFNTNNAPVASEYVLAQTQDTYAATSGGGMLRIIDGKLYVWGSNYEYGLGMSTVVRDGFLASPTEHTHNNEFCKDDDKVVKILTGNYSGVCLLTEKGRIFTWGESLYRWVYSKGTDRGAKIENNGGTPVEWDTSLLDGAIEEIYFTSLAVAVKTTADTWYIAGALESAFAFPNMIDDPNTDEILTLKPVSQALIDKMQPSYVRSEANDGTGEVTNDAEKWDAEKKTNGSARHTIKKVIPSYDSGSCFIITAAPDGTEKLWALGDNGYGANLLPDNYNRDEPHPTYPWSTFQDPDTGKWWSSYGKSIYYPVDVLADKQNAALANAKPDLSKMAVAGLNTTFIDEKGNVWMVGAYDSKIYYDDSVNKRRPQMIYNAEMLGGEAKKVFPSQWMTVILAADNSLYAIGSNDNNVISSENVQYVHKSTQVFEELSLTQTITGVYPSRDGIMVVTESGEQYFSGDNSSGAAGNGTTETLPSGGYVETQTSGVPPVEPLSANEIIFEIEAADENNTYHTYIVNPENEDEIIVDRGTLGEDTLDSSEGESLILESGKIFKLNVYFNDFKKINTFVVPIRFNPLYVRVVNGNGVQYAYDKTVTPGKIGESVGIVQGFNAQTWPGGTLMGDGVADGGYPKICNRNGWVSVAGEAEGKSAITGEQLMFSVYFTAIRKSTDVLDCFNIAYSTDQAGDIDPDFTFDLTAGPTYDPTGAEQNQRGAGWTITNTIDPDNNGRYLFKPDEPLFPSVKTTFVDFTHIGLQVLDENNVEYTNSTTGDGISVGGVNYKGTLISKDNTNTIYTMKVKPDPSNASFPQVTWTLSLKSNQDDNMVGVSDFITIMEQTDTYIRFKIPDGYERQDVGVIEFRIDSKNTNALGQYTTDSKTVIIGNVEAPDSIAIMQKADYPNGVVYHSTITNDAPTTFTATFPGAEVGYAATGVVWRLFDDDGNELQAAGVNNAVTLTKTAPGSGDFGTDGYTYPLAAVAPVHTTFNDDYVVLRVESVYDSSVYDEIEIRVHLYATDVYFSQKQLRLPTDTSRDLNSLLRINPEGDYYDVQLQWTYEPADPANPYLSFDGNGVVTAGSRANDANASALTYDKIWIKDLLSDEEDFIEIAVINLDSPIMPKQVEVFNLRGNQGDYIYVTDGLVEGDVITFYKDYGTVGGTEGVDYVEYGPLTGEYVPFFKFPAKQILSRDGGEIAMTVKRNGDVKNKVPVLYDPEPTKVYGYISLSGKNDVSARNEGISVQLTNGPSTPDVVYTNTAGYFEFETYIQPGNYNLIVYQDNYLRRVIKPDDAADYAGITIPSADEYSISTEDSPIILYPGDINVDGAINRTDINYYVRYWVGQYNTALAQFANFDFYDGAQQVIDLNDLDMVLGRSGWVSESYPKWYVPAQK